MNANSTIDFPGPGKRPSLQELKVLRSGPHEWLLDAARRYGPIIRYPIGPIHYVYLLNSAEAVKHVLRDNNKNYSKDTFQFRLLTKITGLGMLTAEGAHWKRQRRLAQPAFHRHHVMTFGPEIAPILEQMVSRFEGFAERGETLDMGAQMMHVAIQIVAKTLLSMDVDDEADELAQASLVVLDHIVHRARTLGVIPPILPTKNNRAYRRAMKTLDDTVAAMIAERRASSTPPQDLFQGLLDAKDENGAPMFTHQDIRDELVTILVAGHETVASAMTWTWYLLSQTPEQEAALHAELDHVLAGRVPATEDLKNLPTVDRTFQEALRLYPPAWIISRKALEDDTVAGYPIPGGSLVVTSPYVTHRLPEYWNNPEQFDPSRFSQDRIADRPRFAYYPFGGGPRVCIGNHFAGIEAALVISSIAARFRLRLAPDARVVPEPGVTLRPKYGLPMTVERRR